LTPPAEAGGTWTEKTLYRFKSGSAWAAPVRNPVVGQHGEIYGVIYSGGDLDSACYSIDGCGTLFNLTL
jgi:hypothetical protein